MVQDLDIQDFRLKLLEKGFNVSLNKLIEFFNEGHGELVLNSKVGRKHTIKFRA